MLFVISFFAITLFPFELKIAPKRALRVVDSNQQPLNGVLVRQIWDQYSLNVHGEEDFVTANEGQVILPERAIDTNLAVLICGGISNISELTIHASLGSYESIGFMKEGYHNIWFHSAMESLEGDIVLMQD